MMTRSRRRHPYVWLCCDSSKQDKRFANRRLRRINKVRVNQGKEPRIMREVSNWYEWDCDGKIQVGGGFWDSRLRK